MRKSLQFVLIVGIFIPLFSEQVPPWFKMKSEPNANFYTIRDAYQAKQKLEKSSRAKDLTSILLEDPRYYEQEEGFRFNRWASQVEHRVASHDGDLSVLSIGTAERWKLVQQYTSGQVEEAGDWVNLGPYSGNTNGAGRLNWMEFHPQDEDIMLVGAASGGLWKTEDGGDNWAAIADKVSAGIGAAWAVFDPVNPTTIYLGTGDGHNQHANSVGLLKSMDDGETWQTTDLTFDIADGEQIQKVAITPDGSRLFVASTRGLFMSLDGGDSFEQVLDGTIWDIEFKPLDHSIVYATTPSRYYKSIDSGETWTRNSNISGGGNRVYVEVTDANPDFVALLTTTDYALNNLYTSTNSGSTFSNSGDPSEASCSQAWYDVAFAVSPLDEDDMALGCIDNYISSNGGGWFQEHDGSHVDIQGYNWNSRGEIYSMNDGGIYWSNGTGDYQDINNNLSISQGYRIGVFPTDYDRICTGRQDNGTDVRINESRGFRKVNFADGMECFWNLTGDVLYLEIQNGGFERCDYYSDGSVDNCEDVDGGLPDGRWDTPWAQHPEENNTIFAGRGDRFYTSTNQGNSWSYLSELPSSIRNFTISLSDPDVIYAAAGNNLYRSPDGGRNFIDIWASSNGTPYNVAINSSDPDDIWVVVSGYTETEKVYHSSNGGGDWTNETSQGLPNVPAMSVALDNFNDPDGMGVYVGTDAGVFYRDDRFQDWQNFSKDLALASVYEMDIASKDGDVNDRKLVISTFGRGVWTSHLWGEEVVATKDRTQQVITLRNYSARYLGATQTLEVRFQMGRDKKVPGTSKLTLVNSRGQKVFQDMVLNFGSYQKKIDLAGRGAGIYLLTISNGSNQITKRIPVY